MGPLRVLLVEHSEEDTLLIASELQRGRLDPVFERVESALTMQAALEAHEWDVIISDYSLPGFTGLDAVEVCHKSGRDIPFIIVSGLGGEERAVEMLKAGAHDFVMKDHLDRLASSVTHELHAAEERRIRKQSEASAAYLASIVESCDDAIIGKSPDGTVLSWNAGAEKIYGYTAAEMIGKSISVLIPPYRPQDFPEMFQMMQQGEAVDGYETVRMRKDGTLVEVSLTYSPVRSPSGRIIGASVVARDISKRKREDNERLGLIQELTAALSHPQPQPQPQARP